MPKRIGVFSGTFDPIHEGHVLFAQTAIEQMGLDQVIIMPEAKPRRKSSTSDINFRAAMIQKAIAGYPGLSLKLAGSESHTVADTYDELRQSNPESDILFIMGADVFEHLPDWENSRELIENCGFIVALRTEDDGEIAIPLAPKIGAQAEFIPSPLASVSSSRICQALEDNRQPKGLNDDVLDFIRQHNLYGT